MAVTVHGRKVPTYVQFESKKAVVPVTYTLPVHISSIGSNVVRFAEYSFNSTSPQIYRYFSSRPKHGLPAISVYVPAIFRSFPANYLS